MPATSTTLTARIPAARSLATPWAAMVVVLAGTFMVTLDFFIVNVAIPSTQRDLHASPGAIQLIVAGYGIAFACGLITGGRLGDLFGRRRMFAIGLALFTLASAVCGAAPTTGVLIAGRIVQGSRSRGGHGRRRSWSTAWCSASPRSAAS